MKMHVDTRLVGLDPNRTAIAERLQQVNAIGDFPSIDGNLTALFEPT